MNKSFYGTLFIAFLIGVFYPLNTSACRYTIREIGFSDIGSMPYHIYVFTRSDMPEDDISTIEKLSFALLYETNVKLEIVNVDKEKDSITQYYLDKYNIQSFPSALFVFPEGESMICSFSYPGRSFNESVWLLLENLVSSAFRKSIIDQLLRSYCVVLVVEGKNTSKNINAIREANEAIREISKMLDQMPKVVNSPPGILIIPHEKTHKERILLMSLGIKIEEAIEPFVAIIYGRGRIMGPVLQGDQITKRKVFNLLTVVGADCECGLDHFWILGRMIPLRWESSVQSELAQFLGFDVESPLVKAEMSQILSVKPVSENPLNPVEDNLLGYTEGKFEIEKSSQDIPRISASDIRKSFSQTTPIKNNLVFRTILLGFGGILLVVLVAGVFLFLRHKRRNVIR